MVSMHETFGIVMKSAFLWEIMANRSRFLQEEKVATFISKLLKMEVMFQYWLLLTQREVSCHHFLSSKVYTSLMIFFLRPLIIHL
jgi:hypothetical protein